MQKKTEKIEKSSNRKETSYILYPSYNKKLHNIQCFIYLSVGDEHILARGQWSRDKRCWQLCYLWPAIGVDVSIVSVKVMK